VYKPDTANLPAGVRFDREGFVFKHSFSGSRVFEFRDKENENVLTSAKLSYFKKELEFLETNHQVFQTIFISRPADEYFSKGICMYDLLMDKKDYLEKIQWLADSINVFNQSNPRGHLMPHFSGLCSGTAFGIFIGADYPVGTDHTRVYIDELHMGLLPMGGLSHHFAQKFESGKEVVRWMGVSKKQIDAEDLYGMRLISHYGGADCFESFCKGFGMSLPDFREDATKAEQEDMAQEESVSTYMDMRHIGSEDCNFDPDDVGIMEEPIWTDLFAHQTESAYAKRDHGWDEMHDNFHEETGYARYRPKGWEFDASEYELEEYLPMIEECFEPDDVEETRKLLTSWATKGEKTDNKVLIEAAKQALQGMEDVKPAVLEKWFDLTKFAAREEATISEVYAKELLYNLELSKDM
jgi:enoyl-CoA hydratase/carnithine racemase